MLLCVLFYNILTFKFTVLDLTENTVGNDHITTVAFEQCPYFN